MQKEIGVNYCQRCRIYVDVQENSCPLCGGPLMHREQDLPFYSQLPPFAKERESFWQEMPSIPAGAVFRRLITLAVFTLLCTVFVLLALAFLHKGHMGVWPVSYSYAILSVSYAVLVIAFLSYIRKFWIILPCLTVTTILFVLSLDLVDNKIDWSYHRALPVILAVTLPLSLTAFIWKFSRTKGLNVVAVLLFSLALSLCLLDLAVSRRGAFQFMGWSIIPAGSLAALGLYCLYLHYYVKIDWHIDRLFNMRRNNNVYLPRQNRKMHP